MCEGWDNPNVFVICTLKHSDNTISRRQEVGRGLRLCVNQQGDRIDNPAIVHDINVLTVVANESYKDFVTGLQKDISATLTARPRVADEKFFTGKVLKTADGIEHEVTPQMAKSLYRYLLKNDFTDDEDHITPAYHEAKRSETLPELPEDLKPFTDQVFQLVDSVYSDAQLPEIGDSRKKQPLAPNANFEKREFKELWSRINRQAAYSVHFESEELVTKCVDCLNDKLRVTPLQYYIQRGEQRVEATYDDIQSGEAFEVRETTTGEIIATASSAVKYDLGGNLAESTQLRRITVVEILKRLNVAVFGQFKRNPEDFSPGDTRSLDSVKIQMSASTTSSFLAIPSSLTSCPCFGRSRFQIAMRMVYNN